MAVIALLVGLGVVLHRLEALLPLPTPWVKLGLANIMTLIALVFLGFRAAVEVTLLRVLLGSVLGGTFLSPTFFSEPGRRVGLGRRHGFVVPRRAAGLQPGGHQRGGGLCSHHRDFHMRVLFIHSPGRVFQFIAGVPQLFFDLRHPHRPAGKQHHPASDACGYIFLKTPYPDRKSVV